MVVGINDYRQCIEFDLEGAQAGMARYTAGICV
jgi:hypothetical protein